MHSLKKLSKTVVRISFWYFMERKKYF